MTSNTEFTSPPSCQYERALVHYCQLHCWTWPSLACEELSKQLKFPGRIVLSQVLSQGASLLFILFSASVATWKKRQVQGNATWLNTMQRLSRWENKERIIKMLKRCRCHLSAETCFTGFRDKAFCSWDFLLIPSQTARAAKHKERWGMMMKLLTRSVSVYVTGKDTTIIFKYLWMHKNLL